MKIIEKFKNNWDLKGFVIFLIGLSTNLLMEVFSTKIWSLFTYHSFPDVTTFIALGLCFVPNKYIKLFGFGYLSYGVITYIFFILFWRI